jgi:hypothetical protein
MLDVSEESSLERPAESSASSSDNSNEADQATRGTLALRDLIGPTCMMTLYVGVMVPLLFAYLGSSNLLAPYIEQSHWLVSKMAPIWPALPPQYELVLKVRGPGDAASFGFMCAALWMWPVIILVALVGKHVRRRAEILPVSPAEIGSFIVMTPAGFLLLVLDTTTTTSPLARFRVDQWDFFYLRQWFLFSATAVVVATLVYMVGRIILDRIWLRAA